MKAEAYRILDASTMSEKQRHHSRTGGKGDNEPWRTSYSAYWYPRVDRYVIVDAVVLKEVYLGPGYSVFGDSLGDDQPDEDRWREIMAELFRRAENGEPPNRIEMATAWPPEAPR